MSSPFSEVISRYEAAIQKQNERALERATKAGTMFREGIKLSANEQKAVKYYTMVVKQIEALESQHV